MKKLKLVFWGGGLSQMVTVDCPPQMAHLTERDTVYASVQENVTLVELGASAGNADVITAACKWHCAKNEKLEAIKIVRQWTQCGLKEAKDWVEANCY